MKYSIGYHYTTWENWRKIKWLGLKPQAGKQFADVRRDIEIFKGIKIHEERATYLYKYPQSGLSLFGVLSYVSINKASKHIVLLRVEYRSGEDVFGVGNTIVGGHTLPSVGCPVVGFYHKDEPFLYLSKRIPPRRVKLIKEWDLEKVV